MVDFRPSPCESAEVIQVIKTQTIVGNGTADNPARWIIQYWSLAGELLATCDPLVTPIEIREDS